MGLFDGVFSGVGGAIGSLIQAGATNKQNRLSRDFSREMYQLQRDDNLTFWDRQNQYNSPAAQKARLEEAGLSPAFMYGKSGAGGTAGPIKSPEVKAAQFQVPDLRGLGDAATNTINTIYDTRIKRQQENLLKQQVQGKMLANMLSTAKLSYEKELEKYAPSLVKLNLQALQEGVRKLHHEGTSADFRARETNQRMQIAGKKFPVQLDILKQNAARNDAELRMLDKRLQNQDYQNRIKAVMADFAEKGISLSDPLAIRFLIQTIRNYGLGRN